MKRLFFMCCIFLCQFSYAQISKDDLLEMAGYVPIAADFTFIDFADLEKLHDSPLWNTLQETDLHKSINPSGLTRELESMSSFHLRVKLISYKPFRFDPTGTKNLPESFSDEKSSQKDLANVRMPFAIHRAIVNVYRIQSPAAFKDYLKSSEVVIKNDSLLEEVNVYSFHHQAGILNDIKSGDRFLIHFEPDIVAIVDTPKLLMQLYRAYTGELQTLAEDEVFLDFANSGRFEWDQWTLSDTRYRLEQARIQAERLGEDAEQAVEETDERRLSVNTYYRLYATSFESDHIISAEINIYRDSDHFNSCKTIPTLKERFQQQKAELGENIWMESEDNVLTITTRRSKEQALERAEVIYQIGKERLEKQKKARENENQ